MYIISYFKELVKYIQGNPLKAYLSSANILLVFFAIWFSNIGLLPFAKTSDFLIFSTLTLFFALYRPGWAFLFFIGSIALENVNLTPEALGISIRPYQFFGFLSIISFGAMFFAKRIKFALPKWFWVDLAMGAFSMAGFLSAVFAEQKGVAMKQSVVALSFVMLYFLTRIYVQSFSDTKKIWPFFLGPSLVVASYALWQSTLFAKGLRSFEIMPGRPNATFTEPDWLGAYLVFLSAVMLATIFYLIKKNSQKYLLALCFGLLTIVFVPLILSVARSAWLGVAIVSLGFLKMVAYEDVWNFSRWKWKQAGYAFLGITASLFLAVGIVRTLKLTTFELSNRAQSTVSGLQEITIACSEQDRAPKLVKDISELSVFGCKHINLEEVEKEKNSGYFVAKTFRPDPNVGIRARIYEKSWNEIKENPVLGIGWGNIGNVLGKDENGNFLNSSNIFLEVWLGNGLVGLLSFVLVLGYILLGAIRTFIKDSQQRTAAVFVMLGFLAILVPNIFNAGIFLGFLWVYLGMSVSLLRDKTK